MLWLKLQWASTLPRESLNLTSLLFGHRFLRLLNFTWGCQTTISKHCCEHITEITNVEHIFIWSFQNSTTPPKFPGWLITVMTENRHPKLHLPCPGWALRLTPPTSNIVSSSYTKNIIHKPFTTHWISSSQMICPRKLFIEHARDKISIPWCSSP